MAMSPEEKERRAFKKRLKRDHKKMLRSRHSKVIYIIRPIIALLIIASIYSMVSDKFEYMEKERELQALHLRTAELEAENASYASILSETDERIYMERIATEQWGYAYPNERRFYDTTRS